MRIAYICSDVGIPVFGTKGASVHLRSVVEGLQALGHDVRVYSPAVDYPDGAPRNQTFQSIRFEGSAAAVTHSLNHDVREPDHLASEYGRVLYNEYLQRTLEPVLEAERPDFIYERYSLFGYAGLELAERLGVPLLLEVNAPLVEEQQKYRILVLKETAETVEQRLFQRADAIFVVSQALADYATALGAAPERVNVLPNAVSPDRFDPLISGDAVRARYGLDGKKVVGFVGSLKLWHDIDTLVDAATQLYKQDESVRLLVVGDGPRLTDLQAMNAPYIVTTGAVEHDEVPSYLAACDVVAVPYSQHEDQYFSPLKLFEAMAMAKPVVGARIGQVQEVVRDGVSGRLYVPDDATDLAGKLREVLDLPDRGAAMGDAGRQQVLDNHTWVENARRIETVASRLTTHLKRDERLPYLDLAWSAPKMTSLFNTKVIPLVGGEPVATTSLTNLTYRPARQCIALYELASQDAKAAPRHAIATFVKDDRFKEVYRDHYEKQEMPAAVYLPENRCLVEMFPYVWEMPSLPKAADPRVVAGLMVEAGVDLPHGIALSADILTYRPHEACVLAYRDAAGADPFRLVAKTTNESRKADQVHRIAGMLRDQLADGFVSVPKTYRPKDKYIVFMDLAPGVSMHDAIAAADTDTARRDVVRLTALGLTLLHALRIEERLKEKKTLPQGVSHAHERAGRLQFAAPELGAKAERLLDAVTARLPAYDGAMTFLHGDFKGTQVLIDGGRINVIDLDSACIGDPAVDVGNMMADMHREAALADAPYTRALADAFLDEYVALTGREDLAPRARAFRVIALVRMGVHGFRQFAHTYGQPNSQPELLLREAEACLQAL